MRGILNLCSTIPLLFPKAGPELFDTYTMVLKIVLAAIALGLGVVSIVVLTTAYDIINHLVIMIKN